MTRKTWKVDSESIIYDDRDEYTFEPQPNHSRTPHCFLRAWRSNPSLTQPEADQATKSIYGLSVVLTRRQINFNTTTPVNSMVEAFELVDEFVQEVLRNRLARERRIAAHRAGKSVSRSGTYRRPPAPTN